MPDGTASVGKDGLIEIILLITYKNYTYRIIESKYIFETSILNSEL